MANLSFVLAESAQMYPEAIAFAKPTRPPPAATDPGIRLAVVVPRRWRLTSGMVEPFQPLQSRHHQGVVAAQSGWQRAISSQRCSCEPETPGFVVSRDN